MPETDVVSVVVWPHAAPTSARRAHKANILDAIDSRPTGVLLSFVSTRTGPIVSPIVCTLNSAGARLSTDSEPQLDLTVALASPPPVHGPRPMDRKEVVPITERMFA